MTTLFETERIIIRNWMPQEDAAQAFEIYSDPEVMRFIGDGSTANSVELVRNRINASLYHQMESYYINFCKYFIKATTHKFCQKL